MKKDKKERVYFAQYLSILHEIEDDQFEDEESACENMHLRYKGAKKDNFVHSLWRKYKKGLLYLRSFAKKNPRIGNLAELPSGSTQLRHTLPRALPDTAGLGIPYAIGCRHRMSIPPVSPRRTH
jgi:hypothetical protein